MNKIKSDNKYVRDSLDLILLNRNYYNLEVKQKKNEFIQECIDGIMSLNASDENKTDILKQIIGMNPSSNKNILFNDDLQYKINTLNHHDSSNRIFCLYFFPKSMTYLFIAFYILLMKEPIKKNLNENEIKAFLNNFFPSFKFELYSTVIKNIKYDEKNLCFKLDIFTFKKAKSSNINSDIVINLNTKIKNHELLNSVVKNKINKISNLNKIYEKNKENIILRNENRKIETKTIEEYIIIKSDRIKITPAKICIKDQGYLNIDSLLESIQLKKDSFIKILEFIIEKIKKNENKKSYFIKLPYNIFNEKTYKKNKTKLERTISYLKNDENNTSKYDEHDYKIFIHGVPLSQSKNNEKNPTGANKILKTDTIMLLFNIQKKELFFLRIVSMNLKVEKLDESKEERLLQKYKLNTSNLDSTKKEEWNILNKDTEHLIYWQIWLGVPFSKLLNKLHANEPHYELLPLFTKLLEEINDAEKLKKAEEIKKFIYYDIKIANMLTDEKFSQIKIIDFILPGQTFINYYFYSSDKVLKNEKGNITGFSPSISDDEILDLYKKNSLFCFVLAMAESIFDKVISFNHQKLTLSKLFSVDLIVHNSIRNEYIEPALKKIKEINVEFGTLFENVYYYNTNKKYDIFSKNIEKYQDLHEAVSKINERYYLGYY
jgi:hypothetical protein